MGRAPYVLAHFVAVFVDSREDGDLESPTKELGLLFFALYGCHGVRVESDDPISEFDRHHLHMEIGFGAVQGSQQVAGWGQNPNESGSFDLPVKHNGVPEQCLQFLASRKKHLPVCLVHGFLIVLLHQLASRLKPLLEADNVVDCAASVSAVGASGTKSITFHMGCEVCNCFESCAIRGQAKEVFGVGKINNDSCHQADDELHKI